MELVPSDDDLTEVDGGNSATALERLRARLERAAAAGERQLPPERRLAAELSVGRGALRRALEVLEAEGQIWRVQGKGTFLGSAPQDGSDLEGLPSRINPVEVMEARLELEPTLARLAARRATAADIEMMRHLARRVAAATDADGRELWDGALHRRIASAAGNRLLIALFDVVDRVRQDESFRLLRQRARSTVTLGRVVVAHDRIIAAIAARDGAAAEAAMRDHLGALARRLDETMTSDGSRGGGRDDVAATVADAGGEDAGSALRRRSDGPGG